MARQVKHLIAQFKPEHYDLVLKIDKNQSQFNGQIIIRGKKTLHPSQRLTFHQKNLNIESASIERVEKSGSRSILVTRINNQSKFDEVRLHTDEMLYPGNYIVTMHFSGKITQGMSGIYPCFFKHNSLNRKLIATQFESHHAREAFPCIDEPEAKATFDLALLTPEKESSYVSNMPVISCDKQVNGYLTKFETSPLMSTYLLAFIFGDLKYLESRTNSGVVVRTYATADNIEFTRFALDIAVKCLEFYDQYFDISYPLPKCDLIALPDFSSGAMENWGCVTFREQALLVDPANTSLQIKQYVAMVVAHELAHQWFGNLVTMKWWNDLWLNEGFASWIEYLATDHLFPDWEMWTQFIVDEQEVALRLDSLSNTHPIDVPIKHPDEIRSIFDSISYSKGSSIIHMLYHYIGADDFQSGLRYYLKQHSYKNTTTGDLWSAFEHVSKKPVRSFMNTWTSQPGFPIVSATFGGQRLKLSQSRFLINPEAKSIDQKWPVPLLAKPKIQSDTFEQTDTDLDLPTGTNDLILNHERSGFYRVVYDAEHLKILAGQVKRGELSKLDRLSLLSDNAEAAMSGYAPSVETLNLLQNYRSESDSVVWDIIASFFSSIRGVMDDEQLRQAMKPHMRQMVGPQLKRLGWAAHKNESHMDSILRPTILALAAVSDEPTVVKKVLSIFDGASVSTDIPPDLRGVIYGTVARLGGPVQYDRLIEFYKASQNSEEQVTLAGAITAFKQPALIRRTLDLIISDQVRLQDITYWIAYCFSNRYAKRLTWQWLTEHWSWLENNVGDDLSFYRFPLYAARAFSDKKFLIEYRKFFDQHRQPALIRAIDQGVEIIEWQADWRKRDLESLRKYFKPTAN